MEIKVSIITVNYNGLHDTCALIDIIPFNDDLEVIVIDNASKEDEASIIEKRYPEVKVIRSKKNLGFAGGNNLGIKAARGKYLFFINNDTILNPQPSALSPLRLIIAPHQIGEDHLRAIEQALDGCRVLRYSQATEENVATADVLIIDCFGLLSSIYRYGQLAMVGGGFGVGIHNIPEAAVYGIPVIIGPNNQNFREARYLLDAGACFEVHDANEFNHIADHLLTDAEAYRTAAEAARSYIAENSGATDIIYSQTFPQQ